MLILNRKSQLLVSTQNGIQLGLVFATWDKSILIIKYFSFLNFPRSKHFKKPVSKF